MLEHAHGEVADGFVRTRLGAEGGRQYGVLPRGVDTAAILARA
jgi:putative acyl-CoA dehydrogenase